MTFKESYADAYDSLYQDKDYHTEVEIIRDSIKLSGIEVKSIIDVGCGTGEHAIKLAKSGYSIFGVDPSGDMLKIANDKINANNLSNFITLQKNFASDFIIDNKADMAIMMFAVIGYHTTNKEIIDCLKNIRKHIKDDAILIFDFWYGPGVLSDKPSEKIRTIELEDAQLLRLTKPNHRHYDHVVDVNFETFRINKDTILTQTKETHSMRYFFPQEINFFLNCAGFSMVSLSEFPSTKKELTLKSWNALCIAKAQ